VLAFHWIPQDYLLDVPIGRFGVRLFFVISGFLITGILLGLREQPLSHALKTFYARRFLRIFPAYYALLAAGLALAIPFVFGHLKAHALYLSNIYFARRGAWDPYTGHFWTLAVEEQFYLAWPLIVLTTPQRWLGPIIAMLVGIGPLSRLALYAIGANVIEVRVLPTSCLDTLAGGAMLAYASWRGIDNPRIIAPLAIAGGLTLCGLSALRIDDAGLAVLVFQDLACASFFAGILMLVRRRRFAALSWPPLVYLGTISYGIYLVHGFAAAVPVPGPWWSRALVWGAITVAVASASWFALERPINNLKRFFPYQARPSSASLQPSAPSITPAMANL
jgi:peptidoglycan/LPS O-acetylase OafA/YrhL